MIVLTVLLSWLLADFISGLVHWYEDRAMVGASRFKFLNGVREDNERHHRSPGWFLTYSWWENINTTAPIAWGLATVLWLLGAPLFIILTTAFLGFGNLVHRWSHEKKKNIPLPVQWIQSTGLFISFHHHMQHHLKNNKPVSREDSSRRFCVMTNWLNPWLDYIKFFHHLERLIKRKPQ